MNSIESADKLLQEFLSQKAIFFSDLKPSMLDEDVAVVYAIFNKDTKETLYVGRTKKLRRRLYTNHLMGPKTNARLKKYLVEDPNETSIETMDDAKAYLREKCYFKYMEVPDMRLRGQIEGLLGYLLDVRYIHEEH